MKAKNGLWSIKGIVWRRKKGENDRNRYQNMTEGKKTKNMEKKHKKMSEEDK